MAIRLAGLAVTWLATAPSVAAEPASPPVYKCLQQGGAVLYADYPCKGGTVVDIRPGVAAPDATERLARARDELDRAAARRQAFDDDAALRLGEIDARRRDENATQPFDSSPYISDYAYLPAYGYYPPYGGARLHRPGARPPVDRPRAGSERRVPAVIRRP